MLTFIIAFRRICTFKVDIHGDLPVIGHLTSNRAGSFHWYSNERKFSSDKLKYKSKTTFTGDSAYICMLVLYSVNVHDCDSSFTSTLELIHKLLSNHSNQRPLAEWKIASSMHTMKQFNLISKLKTFAIYIHIFIVFKAYAKLDRFWNCGDFLLFMCQQIFKK